MAPQPEQRCACFSEIPLDFLSRLVERRASPYGLAFLKTRIAATGGGRVWYVDKDSPLQQALYQHQNRLVDGSEWENAWFRMAPFIDYPGNYGNADYRFEWEREWRHPGDLLFGLADIQFFFAPAEEHAVLAAEIVQAAGEAGYQGAPVFLDPMWDFATLQANAALL